MIVRKNKSKIIATYGPAFASEEGLKDLIRAGADCIRFNFSHGDQSFHKEGFGYVKKINEEHGLSIAILADLQGPKIRCGTVSGDHVILEEDSTVTITDKEGDSTATHIFVNYPKLAAEVKKGDKVLINDGQIRLEVLESLSTHEFTVKVVTGGKLSSRKGVNLPDTDLSLPSLTEKDKKDLAFALEQEANWIALSFVRSPEDVTNLRKIIGEKGNSIKVIAKIEKPEAVKNIDEIIRAANGIMVARGDLGVEVPQEQMPLIQKEIIKKCILRSRPVIVATQMLESMTNSPVPTRAEITDVANAVIDGADAVMLSGETSVGKYPVKAVETMQKILANIEMSDLIYDKELIPTKDSTTFLSDAICYNACKISKEIGATAIIGMTRSGYTGFKLSSYRPKANVYIFTNNRHLLSTLNICWGVKALHYDKFLANSETIDEVIKLLKNKGLLQEGEVVINTASMPITARTRTNMLKISKVK